MVASQREVKKQVTDRSCNGASAEEASKADLFMQTRRRSETARLLFLSSLLKYICCVLFFISG